MPDDGLFDTCSIGLSDDAWWIPERDARENCVEQNDAGENIGLVASRTGLATFGWNKWGVGSTQDSLLGANSECPDSVGEESGRSITAPQ
jgi:hypothetical protein